MTSARHTTPISVRRQVVLQSGRHPHPSTTNSPPSALETARRVGESLVIAIVTSTGLYLVGSVYTSAYYSRMSVEVTSLYLDPPYVALQSIHALPGLLEYPSTLLLFWILYRTVASRAHRMREWSRTLRPRIRRLLVVLANVAVVGPLVANAFLASSREGSLSPDSVLAEVTGMRGTVVVLLLIYVIWLGWSQRTFIVTQIRARQILPIALVFLVYLLTALASTASVATNAAMLLMTGDAIDSMGVTLTMKEGVAPVAPGRELILVTARNNAFFAVERQASPPDQRPITHIVPFSSVDAVTVQRLNDADASLFDLVINDRDEP